MSGELVTLCRFEGCRRAAAYPDQARCAEHRLRWMPGQPVEERKPAWVERMAMNAKILGGTVA